MRILSEESVVRILSEESVVRILSGGECCENTEWRRVL